MLPLAAEKGFYEAVAQVLPILLLLITVGETRLQKRHDVDRPEDLKWGLFLTLTLALFVVAGELASLRVLAHGRDSELEESLAIGGIAAGLTSLVRWVLSSSFDEYRKDFSPTAQIRQLRLQLLICMAVALGVFLSLK